MERQRLQREGQKMIYYIGIKLKNGNEDQQRGQSQLEVQAGREPSPASDEEFIQDQAIKRGNYGTWMCKRCEYRDDMAGMMTHLKRYHMK
jgi:hypothetical protein